MQKLAKLLILFSVIQAPIAFATGADDLQKLLGGSSATTESITVTKEAPIAQDRPKINIIDTSKFVLGDAFALKFLAIWQSANNLPPEINTWSLDILNGKYDAAVQAWDGLQTKLPENFRDHAKSAHLYCLWKLNLSQTFFNEWLSVIHLPSFRSSLLNTIFESVISSNFDRWILDRAIVIDQEQKSFISALDEKAGFLNASLKAYIALRSGKEANTLLAILPADHQLKLPLAETAMLAAAKQGDLAAAAKILKFHLEPALQARKDTKLLSQYYLEIARLLYQAGSYEGAEQYYLKIPSGVDQYVDAREELMWVWLRQGNSIRLRGELESLRQPIFANRFSPELYLVRAISNLKFCFYNELNQDFADFIHNNTKWAKEIMAAESAQDLQPPQKDFFTLLLERAYRNLRTESQALAAYPNWKNAQNSISVALNTVREKRSAEYRRQWKNRREILAEAIRKMKFVKIEYLSQMRELAKGDQITMHSAAPEIASQKKKIKAENSAMSFPYDGTYWPDEVFKLRSAASSQCTRKF